MSEHELLEAAAKAAGIDAEFHPELGHGPEGMWLKGARSPDNSKYWNPLNDDGDALRLAVKLRIRIAGMGQRAYAFTGLQEFWENEDTDPYAATRRAIVRVAAEIGRAEDGREKK